MKPYIDRNGVGWCEDSCPEHDGKRCKLIGFRPEAVCEPWAIKVVRDIDRMKKENADLKNEIKQLVGEGTASEGTIGNTLRHNFVAGTKCVTCKREIMFGYVFEAGAYCEECVKDLDVKEDPHTDFRSYMSKPNKPKTSEILHETLEQSKAQTKVLQEIAKALEELVAKRRELNP